MDKVLGNEDIMRHIYSFGYPEHRFYMKCIQFHMKDKKYNITNNMHYILDDWSFYVDSQIYGAIYDLFLHKLLNKKNQKKLIKQLGTCYCCNRHCQNRPRVVFDEIIYHDDGKKYQKDEECQCMCRQMSRDLLHIYDFENYYHDLSDSEFYLTPTNLRF